MIPLAEAVEALILSGTLHPSRSVSVAVMGCAVNGPGEAREADIGIAGGVGEALLFKKGEIVGKLPEQQILRVLRDEINRM